MKTMKIIEKTLTSLLLLLASGAWAATFDVDTETDAVDSNPGDGACQANLGGGGGGSGCSLRAAIMEANALAGIHIINVPAGNYVISLSGTDDTGEAGDLDILADDLTIHGAGAGTTTIDANGIARVIHIMASNIGIHDLTIRGGNAVTGGGVLIGPGSGVKNGGTLSGVHLLENGAEVGGAIRAVTNTELLIEKSLIQSNVTIEEGVTNNAGAAIYCQGCELTMIGTTVADNGDNLSTEVITVEQQASVGILNSTISGSVNGGIRATNANVSILFSTLVNNGLDNLSFFSFDDSHVFEVGNSVLLNEAETFDNCSSGDLPASLGYNVLDDDSCAFANTGDLQNTDPMLGALADNGGPTPTFLPLAGSPAIDRVPSDQCKDLDGAALGSDQRENARPFGTACDSGSVEVEIVSEVIFTNGFEN